MPSLHRKGPHVAARQSTSDASGHSNITQASSATLGPYESMCKWFAMLAYCVHKALWTRDHGS